MPLTTFRGYGTSELVPFPSLAGLRVRGFCLAVHRLPQRLKPSSCFGAVTARVNSCPSRAWRAFGSWFCLGCSRLASAAEAGFLFRGGFGTSQLVPFPGVTGLRFVVCFGCSRLASAAEAGLLFWGGYGTSELVPFPGLLTLKENSPLPRSGRARLPVVPLRRSTSRGFSRRGPAV